MINLLFYACVFTLSLGQFSVITKNLGLNVYLFDITLAIYGFLGVAQLLKTKKFILPRPFLLLFVFLMFGLLSFLINLPNISWGVENSALYLVRLFLYILAALITYNTHKQGLLSLKQLTKTFILSALLLSLAGFLQLYLLPDFEKLDSSLGWDPHKNRLASTFFDPNFMGMYLSLCLLIIANNFRYVGKLLAAAVSLVLVIAIFLTFSRSAWIALAAFMFIYGIFRYRFLIPISVLCVFLAYYAVPRVQTRLAGITDPADSAQYRVVSWKNSLKIINDNLLMGVGYNNIRQAHYNYGFLTIDDINKNSASGTDSSILFILATTGIAGLGIFMWSVWEGILLGHKKGNTLFILTLFVMLLINSQFINSVFYPPILFFWTTWFGVSLTSRI